VTPFDAPTIAVVLVTLACVALAASFVPARRATLIDPAKTMRVD
jgi:ABC-type lipoprotein release transport system permease subunit